jgi:protein phosphatase
VNELLKSGRLSEEEAQVHPQRSVITRAVGTDPDVDVDGFTIEAEEGDVFLLCSDGLTDMVSDVEILELVHAHRGDLDKAVKSLVSAANRGGGEDNITAVAFRISADAPASPEDTVAMPAIPETDGEPDEQTREQVPEPEPAPPAADARRVRLVLIGLVLLLVVAAVVIWGLSR